MNLTAYRRELKAASLEFAQAVTAASERMGKRIAVADAEFFEDKREPVEAELPMRWTGEV